MRNANPRSEHPRPDFMRDTFFNLNGQWQFAYDDGDAGLAEGWQRPGTALPIASCLVSMIPPLMLYLFAQKYFLQGISVQAAVKG